MPYKDKNTARIKGKAYRESHKEQIYNSQKDWCERNKVRYLARIKLWRNTHKDKCREYEQAYELRLKTEVLTHYGNGECKCVICGEVRLPCLSIDHINGGGTKHRLEINNSGGKAFYRWLKQHNYPEGYQTLCMNCQFMNVYLSRMVKKENA